jgi:hypothetical protein
MAINPVNRGLIGTYRFACNVENVGQERQIDPAVVLSFLLSSHAADGGTPGYFGWQVIGRASAKTDCSQGWVNGVFGRATWSLYSNRKKA